jgi:hypothetical protein
MVSPDLEKFMVHFVVALPWREMLSGNVGLGMDITEVDKIAINDLIGEG